MNAYRKLAEVFVVLGLLLTQWQPTIAKAGPPPPPLVDGQVYSVFARTTLYGIHQAMIGKPGTAILAKDGAFLFVWNIENGFAFAGIRAKQAISNMRDITNGNFVNANTAKDFAKWLAANGWAKIARDEVPSYLRKAIVKAIAGAGWLNNMVNTLPTFIFVFPTMPVMPAWTNKVEG